MSFNAVHSSQSECPIPTHQQLQEFHAVLRAAQMSGVALDLDGRLIDQLESQSQLRFSSDSRTGNAVQESVEDWTDAFPDAYAASLSAFVQTGRSDLALDRLYLKHAVDRDLTLVSRSTWLYLALMMMVAATGMMVFATFSTPMIESMRADMELSPSQGDSDRVNLLNKGLSATSLVWLALVTFGVAILLVVVVSTTRFAAWSVGWIGGSQYRVALSAVLDERIRQSKSDDKSALTLSSNYLQKIASSRLVRLRIVVPLLLIILVGGGGVMAYCWLLFSPLIALIHELSNAMIWSNQ